MKTKPRTIPGRCEFCGKRSLRVSRVTPAPQVSYLRGQSFVWACAKCGRANTEMHRIAAHKPDVKALAAARDEVIAAADIIEKLIVDLGDPNYCAAIPHMDSKILHDFRAAVVKLRQAGG